MKSKFLLENKTIEERVGALNSITAMLTKTIETLKNKNV